MYGIFLHNDFSGGEFPGLINSLRRIKSEDQSRYVSIPRSSLEKVAKYIPEMRPVLNVYPAPPGKDSYYYQRWGVYDQWPDSHNLIWIKDAIFNAKVAANAKNTQLFYKNISNKIDLLCEQKVLDCTSKGKGLIRAPSSVDDYLLWINGFYNSILAPFTQHFILSFKGDNLVNTDDIDTNIMVGNEYAYIAMTSFDSLTQFNEKIESRVPVTEEEKKYSLVKANLIYWLLYPDVAVSNGVGVSTDLRGKISSIAEVNERYIVSPLFNKNAWMNYDYKLGLGLAFLVQNESYARLFASSIQSNERLGGEVHYMNCGRDEGRSWLLSANTNTVNSPLIIHKSLLSKWKSLIYILKYTVLIFVVALIKLIIDLIKRPKIFFNPIIFLFVSFLTYYIVFSIAMGYINGRS
jgi:hypothetical protein